jgi:hypothetical protein
MGCRSYPGYVLGFIALFSAHGAVSANARIEHIRQRLAGQLIEFTRQHRSDNRIWSNTLNQRRDLFVYLPPGYDSKKQYPVVLWLHGVLEDERGFVVDGSLIDWDQAMACGRLPPMIIAIPDGSVRGRPSLLSPNPLWINSNIGQFEDLAIDDVWPFVIKNFPIRPERQAHVVAGYSGGGMAAFRLAIKHRELFGVVIGVHPALNVRWLDCHGRYFTPFDPCCWGWREDMSRGHQPVGRFYGVVVIRIKHLVYPLFGKNENTVEQISRENPIEMIDLYNLREGELAMYVNYGGRDQFNITAQVDSFLYRAKERGLAVDYGFDPKGKHDPRTAAKLRPSMFHWLNEQMAPYSPAWQPPLVFLNQRED